MLSWNREHFQTIPEAQDDVAVPEDAVDSPDVDEEINSDQLEKEQEVWDAFREEHFEAVEQMPLTLHRQFSLMQELDQQAHSYMADLLPTIQKYISQRQDATPRRPSEGTLVAGNVAVQLKKERPPSPPSVLDNSSLLRLACSGTGDSAPAVVTQASPLATPTPMGVHPERAKPPQTTWERLSHIAWLSEELLRASDEKVNLALAAYESVDRHIRILDQAIKEQEDSISLGRRPRGLAPGNLPDLVVPRWKAPRLTLSPIDDDEIFGSFPNVGVNESGGSTLGSIPDDDGGHHRGNPLRGRGRRGRGSGRGRGRSRAGHEGLDPSLRQEMGSLKITLPAQPGVLLGDAVTDPSEKRYCYCDRVSFDEMIGCDSGKCKREWFHLVCVGLTGPPPGPWYCSECTANGKRRRK